MGQREEVTGVQNEPISMKLIRGVRHKRTVQPRGHLVRLPLEVRSFRELRTMAKLS